MADASDAREAAESPDHVVRRPAGWLVNYYNSIE
jgi:hypothetical protein